MLTCNLPGILCALAHGATINAVATSSDKTPMLLSIESVSTERRFIVAQFIIEDIETNKHAHVICTYHFKRCLD